MSQTDIIARPVQPQAWYVKWHREGIILTTTHEFIEVRGHNFKVILEKYRDLSRKILNNLGFV
jgi:hypothetical protein